MRRAGYAARASGLFARSAIAARRNILNNSNEDHQLPFGGIMMDGYYHDFFESMIDGDVDMGAAAADDDDDEHAMALMAMEASRLSNRSSSAGTRFRAAAAMRGVGPRLGFDAARSFALPPRETAQRLTPDELLRAAGENDSLYQPKWMNPSQIGGRMRTKQLTFAPPCQRKEAHNIICRSGFKPCQKTKFSREINVLTTFVGGSGVVVAGVTHDALTEKAIIDVDRSYFQIPGNVFSSFKFLAPDRCGQSKIGIVD